MTPNQIDALRQIQRTWPGRTSCLIGAVALSLQVEPYWRETQDLDITIAVSIDELTAEMSRLAKWTQHTRLEHRWTSPDGVRIDILPAGSETGPVSPLVWPQSGQVMSRIGFRLAFKYAKEISLASGFSFYVAPLHVIVLLKIVSYMDRPFERERDLADIAFLLEEYLAPDDERRFDDTALEKAIPYPHASAFILGKDLSEIVIEQELSVIHDFLNRTRDIKDQTSTQGRMLAQGPMAWDNEPEELLARINALELGLSVSS